MPELATSQNVSLSSSTKNTLNVQLKRNLEESQETLLGDGKSQIKTTKGINAESKAW